MRNVLIVNADQILGAVVSNLLMAEQEIALANFTPLCPTEIIEQLRTQDPDVLILANNLVNESVLQQILAKAKFALYAKPRHAVWYHNTTCFYWSNSLYRRFLAPLWPLRYAFHLPQ